jgi:hypothetical protein
VAVQAPAQLIPSAAHKLLPQLLVVAAVQLPEPLHTEAVVALPAAQLAAVQTVEAVGKAQAVASMPSHWALHLPVPPQAARGLTGSPLTALHLPSEPASLHDWHCPLHFPSQQTPSTQLPDVH